MPLDKQKLEVEHDLQAVFVLLDIYTGRLPNEVEFQLRERLANAIVSLRKL